MATTISRLSAVLTAETSQFQAGMAKASNSVKSFGFSGLGEVDSGLRKFIVRVGASTAGMGKLGKIINSAISIGPIGILTGITAAVGMLALKLAKLGDASADLKIQNLRDYQKAWADVNDTSGQTAAILAGQHAQVQTSEEKWKRLKDVLGDFAENAGFSTTGFADTIQSFIPQMDVERFEAQRRVMETLKKATQELKDVEESRRREIQHEIDLIDRDMTGAIEKAKSKAEQLKQSLATPFEKMGDAMRELDNLRDAGFISGETFTRGIQKAADDYSEAMRRITEAKSAISSTPALERGTVAEFSARTRAAQENAKVEAAVKVQTKVVEQVRDEIKGLRKQPTVNLKIGRLTGT